MSADRDIRTAVITGRHPFDVPAFYQAFRSLPGVEFYPQPLEEFAADAGRARDWYDVLVFYNFHQGVPGTGGEWWERGVRESLDRLGQTDQGILVLHHALVAFREWDFWSELVGIRDRGTGYDMGQQFRVEVADPDHPITRGMSGWEMEDETYSINDTGPGSRILLTTRHPVSMKTLAWTRQLGNARVFCCQSGHDSAAFGDLHFRTVLGRGIQWLAHRL